MVSEHDRVREAYIQMAKKAKYRPQAPSDGLGNIQLAEEELNDSKQLDREASDYADRFIKEEDSRKFRIGVSNFETNRAFVYAIEASRLPCGGYDSAPFALKLLDLAAEDVKTSLDGSSIVP